MARTRQSRVVCLSWWARCFAPQLWRDSLQDLDLVLAMLGLASGRPAAVLLDMLQTLGALPLLQAAGETLSLACRSGW